MKTTTIIFSLLFVLTGIFSQNISDSGFNEAEIALKTASGDLMGTLTVPIISEPCPVVIIIAGSGPTDRDGNSPAGLKTNAYKMVSVGLAMKNIASLRFDKRGIGKSKGAMTSEADLRFETYIKDVVDWISLLKEDKRFSSIFILGHSEGSLIGMIASEQMKIDGFISIAGAGKSADQLIQDQLKTKLPLQLLNESFRILDSLKNGRIVSDVNPNLFALFRPSVQPYMISWMKYDPAREIRKLNMPVLIIQGSTDIQVSTDEAKILSIAKPEAKLILIENMNHVLKESGADLQTNMAAYRNPDLPLHSELMNPIIAFIYANKE